MAKTLRTARLTLESLTLLQEIMALTDTKQPVVLERLIKAERKRLERQRTTRADWNRL